MIDLPKNFEEFQQKISDLLQKKQNEEKRNEEIISVCSALIAAAEKGRKVSRELLMASRAMRGIAYFLATDFQSTQNALIDLHEANNLDTKQALKQSLKFNHPAGYIASHAKTAETLHFLKSVFNFFCELQSKLADDPSKSKKIAHYTELRVLKNLVQGEPFRLYNVGYMHDLKEGETFFKIIKKFHGGDICAPFYSSEGKNSYSPVYVGSFVRVGEREYERENGSLLFWRTYGKNDKEDGSGACIHFNAGRFAGKFPIAFGQMFPNQLGDYQNCICRVVYEHEVAFDKDLQVDLQILVELLKSAVENDWEDEKEGVYKIIRELLDQIRFLFKSDHYSAEKELRIVQSHYPEKSGRLTADGAVKTDIDSFPPRFFVEVENLPLETVIFGPAARKFWGWKQWLKQQNSTLEVRKSEIPYGERN